MNIHDITVTPLQIQALKTALARKPKVSKESVDYRPSERCGNCSMYVDNNACTLVEGFIDPEDVCDQWDSRGGSKVTEKSAETPIVSTVHHPLGTEGLWHTPSKKVPQMQQLPAYIQNTARALMRDQGMGEQQAIATAVNAVKEWAQGRAFGGKVKVTPQVREAASRALDEWEQLRASHH